MGRAVKRTMSIEQVPEDEAAIISQFRLAVADILTPENDDENYLRKWLIARKYNIEKAEDMLRKHVQFFKQNELDKITPEFVPHEASNYFYTTMLGYDNEGSIVRLIRVGVSDIRACTTAMPKADAIKHAYFLLLSDHDRQKRDIGTSACDKQIYIIDLQGLAWRSIIYRPVVERTFMLLKTYEANHPENLKIAYIVNVPSFFSLVYNWLKTVLPDTIVSKIQVLSTDEVGDALSKQMDLSIVPAFLGGHRRDPNGDGTCPSLFSVPPGTPLPERLMASNLFAALLNDPAAKRTVVENRSSLKVEVAIDVPESILQWDFQTVHNDIRMGLNLKEDNDQSKELIPIHRVESHRLPESGQYECHTKGIYEIIFDNTYSWLTKKELVYKVNVLSPNNNKNM